MKERNLGKASAFRCKLPQCLLTVLHSFSDSLIFINHKLLLLGVYFSSGLTSQPWPQSCCKAVEEELQEKSPSITSRAGKVTPVLWQSCHAVKWLFGHSHVPPDQEMWRTWPWVSYCPVMGFWTLLILKHIGCNQGALAHHKQGGQLGALFSSPYQRCGLSSPVKEEQIHYPPRQTPDK